VSFFNGILQCPTPMCGETFWTFCQHIEHDRAELFHWSVTLVYFVTLAYFSTLVYFSFCYTCAVFPLVRVAFRRLVNTHLAL